MLAILLVLIVLGFILQKVIMVFFKTNVPAKQYELLILSLLADTIFAIGFILSAYFEMDIIVQKVAKYLLYFGTASFFYIYMNVLKDKRKKSSFFVFLFVSIATFILVFFGQYFSKTGFILSSIVIVVAWLAIMYVKKIYASNRIMLLVYILVMAEIIRFAICSAVTYQLLFTHVEDLWLVSVSYMIRAILVLLIIEIHGHITINKNLARTLSYHSASSLLSLVFEEHPNAVVLTDMKQKIVYVNPEALRLTGYAESDVIDKTPKIFASGLTDRSVYKNMFKSLNETQSWTGEFINKKRNGEFFTELSKIVTLLDVNQKPVFYLAIKTDITKEKLYLSQLEYRLNFDDLTGLLQRHKFLNIIEKTMLDKQTPSGYFVLFDIDEFKKINDNFGHLIGDKALIHFANILKSVFKTYGFVCRFGGDEFAAYIDDIDKAQAYQLLETVGKRLTTLPIAGLETDIYLKTSIGASIIEKQYLFNVVYDKTDKYLYQAKNDKAKAIVTDFN